MNILLLEPFYTGSHKRWAEELQQHSRHHIKISSIKGFHWKWRMHGGAVTLAKRFLKDNFQPDLILATDMLDLSTFLALTRQRTHHIPTAIYFHENQLTYPWSPKDADVKQRRDNHYSFINYTSALAADTLFFNSTYHQQSFINALPTFLKQFPDYQNLDTIQMIEQKSKVLHLGMNLSKFDPFKIKQPNKEPIILWNHRWEYDKNPASFFRIIDVLDKKQLSFKLVLLGESYEKIPKVFQAAKERLQHRILHFGYADSFQTYAEWLWKSDIALTTSNQDFFGGSVVEAIYCDCIPLLPNRLAYPEHIPTLYHKDLFYNDEKEAITKLEKLLNGFSVSIDVSRYDWKNSIELYDEFFERLIF